jgi:hypothetical protein
MKKKFFLLCISMFLIHGYGIAILPPLYHTLAEFKAVIEAPELTQDLQSGEAILSITLDENAKFTVLTNKHKLVVDVVYEHTNKIGPAKFHLVFHEAEPLNL